MEGGDLAVYVIVCSVSECTAVIRTETRMETDVISSRKCSKKKKQAEKAAA